ncbi:MAG: hypothetical protein ACYYK0_07070 [Candidatus Eutrophobiaceae bacterium]
MDTLGILHSIAQGVGFRVLRKGKPASDRDLWHRQAPTILGIMAAHP